MCPQIAAQKIVDRLAGTAAKMAISRLRELTLPGASCAQRTPRGKPLNTSQERGDAGHIAGQRGRKAHSGGNLPGQPGAESACCSSSNSTHISLSPDGMLIPQVRHLGEEHPGGPGHRSQEKSRVCVGHEFVNHIIQLLPLPERQDRDLQAEAGGPRGNGTKPRLRSRRGRRLQRQVTGLGHDMVRHEVAVFALPI